MVQHCLLERVADCWRKKEVESVLLEEITFQKTTVGLCLRFQYGINVWQLVPNFVSENCK